jgi:hypothetical protein
MIQQKILGLENQSLLMMVLLEPLDLQAALVLPV